MRAASNNKHACTRLAVAQKIPNPASFCPSTNTNTDQTYQFFSHRVGLEWVQASLYFVFFVFLPPCEERHEKKQSQVCPKIPHRNQWIHSSSHPRYDTRLAFLPAVSCQYQVEESQLKRKPSSLWQLVPSTRLQFELGCDKSIVATPLNENISPLYAFAFAICPSAQQRTYTCIQITSGPIKIPVPCFGLSRRPWDIHITI